MKTEKLIRQAQFGQSEFDLDGNTPKTRDGALKTSDLHVFSPNRNPAQRLDYSTLDLDGKTQDSYKTFIDNLPITSK